MKNFTVFFLLLVTTFSSWAQPIKRSGFTTNAPGATVDAANSSVTNLGTVKAVNYEYALPRWTDIITSGLALRGGPLLEPDLLPISSGSLIFAYHFDQNDTASFSCQSSHSLARTNALFPNFYFEPHGHVSKTNVISGATNITFRLELQVSAVGSTYTNVATYLRTNTVAITRASEHVVLSFGNITNNSLQGHHSVIFRGAIQRLTSAANDAGAGKVISVDSIDIHVPFDQLGSSGQYSN